MSITKAIGLRRIGKAEPERNGGSVGHSGKARWHGGSKVEAFAEAGRLDEIASYCRGDVITTFRLLLRFALVRGEIDAGLLEQSERSLDDAVERQVKQNR